MVGPQLLVDGWGLERSTSVENIEAWHFFGKCFDYESKSFGNVDVLFKVNEHGPLESVEVVSEPVLLGTVWDATNKQCVTPSYKDSQSEPFVGERCLQNSFDKADFNVNIFKNNNVINGYSENNDNYAKF